MNKEQQSQKTVSTKDWWDKANIIISNVAKVLVGVLVVYIGNQYSNSQIKLKTQETNMQLYSQLMADREHLRNTHISDSINPIVKELVLYSKRTLERILFDMNTHYKQNPTNRKENYKTELNKVLYNLDFITSNKHDQLHLKPVFLMIKHAILNDKKNKNAKSILQQSEKEELLTKLDHIALKTLQRQQVTLEQVGLKRDHDIIFQQNNLKNTSYQNTIEINNTKYFYDLQYTNKNIKKKQIELHLTVINPKTTKSIERDFQLTYFDFPMVSSIHIADNIRCSIILTSLDEIAASITLIFFPEVYASLQDKTYYDDVLLELVTNKPLNSQQQKTELN